MINDELSSYVEEFKKGNTDVFDKIYNATNNQLYNVIYSFTKDKELSYDLMQETYVTFYKKAEDIYSPGSIQKWFTVVAINKAKRYLQTKKKDILVSKDHENIFENQEDPDQDFLPQEILDNKEKQKMIGNIIDNLPLEQKTAVYLYYFNEMSLSEVASEMQCSEGTVKSRLNYARKKIRSEVEGLEKKGTKLYSAAAPVIVLLLKYKIDDSKVMRSDKAYDILKSIKSSNIGTSSISGIHKAINSKIAASCIIGAVAVSIAGGYFIYNHKQNDSANNNKQITAVDKKEDEKSEISSQADDVKTEKASDEDQECDFYWTYAELGIDSVSSLSVSDSSTIEAYDFKDDKCVGAEIKPDGSSYNVYVYVNGKPINLYFDDDIWNEDSKDENGDRFCYVSFKEVAIGDIESINVSDSNVIDASLNKEQKYILIKNKGAAGKSTITAANDKGEKADINIECSKNPDGKIYFSSESITD